MNQRAGILNRTVVTLFVSAVLFGQVCFAKYSGGSGTAGDPYKIGSSADLLALAANTDDYGANFILTADINLTGHTFTTAVIATDIYLPFYGVFDGAGHKISNLTINTQGEKCDYLGLFGYKGWNGQIKNLGVQNVNIIAGAQSQRIAALVGENNQGNITNCFSTGTIVVADNAWSVGGLAGLNEDGNINYCYSTVVITGGENGGDIGGLVGFAGPGSNISDCCSMGKVSSGDASWYLGGLVGFNTGNIIRCYSTGNITSGNGVYYLGGLVGTNWEANIIDCFSTGAVTSGNESEYLGGLAGGNEYDANIMNCFSIGAVTGGDNSYGLGGLVGTNDIIISDFAVISNCYSTGIVKSGESSWAIGGLLGYNYKGSINNCYFLSGVGPADGNGVPLTDTQMKQQASFVGWDFVNIWTINEGVSYPKFVWQPDFVIPSAPTGVSASDGTYTDHVRVTWDSVPGAAEYEIWRNTSDSSDSASKLGEYTSHFDDSGVTPGTTYYYWVKARNSCGTSDFSSSDSGYASTNPSGNYVSIAKCTVIAGSKNNSDKISFSGTMNPISDNLYLTNYIQIFIDSGDMSAPRVVMIPINNANYKKTGKSSYSGTEEDGIKKSFKLDLETHKFALTAQNINLSGLSCPLNIRVNITQFNEDTIVDEVIVNGPKKPIPINLLMGVKDSLRVDKSKFTKKSGSITQFAVSGGFSVEHQDVNMTNRTSEDLVVTLGTQTFTIPASNLKAGKNKFTCSKVNLYDVSTLIGIASATFDFNKCTFTLTIKSTDFTAASGTANFGIIFAGFSGSDVVTLPP